VPAVCANLVSQGPQGPRGVSLPDTSRATGKQTLRTLVALVLSCAGQIDTARGNAQSDLRAG
jgi:hypothetical protein